MLDSEAEKMAKKYLKLKEPIRLDIGGGTMPRWGFLSVDPYTKSDLPYSATDLPLADDSVDEVYSSHSLEHFSKHEVPKVLGEIYRVLRPAHIFTVEVPDFVYCVREWMKTRDTGFNMDRVFGLQTDPGQAHKIGFTRDSLEGFLKGAGFEIVSFEYVWSHSQDCFLVVAKKPT